MPDRLHLPNLAEKTPNPTTYRSLDPIHTHQSRCPVVLHGCNAIFSHVLYFFPPNTISPTPWLPSPALFFSCVCAFLKGNVVFSLLLWETNYRENFGVRIDKYIFVRALNILHFFSRVCYHPHRPPPPRAPPKKSRANHLNLGWILVRLEREDACVRLVLAQCGRLCRGTGILSLALLFYLAPPLLLPLSMCKLKLVISYHHHRPDK